MCDVIFLRWNWSGKLWKNVLLIREKQPPFWNGLGLLNNTKNDLIENAFCILTCFQMICFRGHSRGKLNCIIKTSWCGCVLKAKSNSKFQAKGLEIWCDVFLVLIFVNFVLCIQTHAHFNIDLTSPHPDLRYFLLLSPVVEFFYSFQLTK